MNKTRTTTGDRAGLTLAIAAAISVAPAARCQGDRPPSAIPERLWVDVEKGRDRNPGTERRPVRTLSAALALLPEPLTKSVVIELGAGEHPTTGGIGMPDNVLELMLRMRPSVEVTIVGPRGEGAGAVLAWQGGRAMVDARDGHWRLEGLQIGSMSLRQRRGVMVESPALVTLDGVAFRTRSQSDAGIYAHRGGRVELRGAIRLNEHLRDEAPEESFCGIIAVDHGSVEFVEREGASLELGNGSLSARYWGLIRLGCATAEITSWSDSNCLALANSARIDLHDTATTLRARKPNNTPIGPEHDGHILAEGARLIIEGENDCAITLQKASTLTCNDIELRGTFRKALWAMSGSMFVGRFIGDVSRVEARTGASVHIEKVSGTLHGPVEAHEGARVSLPDGTVVSGDGS